MNYLIFQVNSVYFNRLFVCRLLDNTLLSGCINNDSFNTGGVVVASSNLAVPTSFISQQQVLQP